MDVFVGTSGYSYKEWKGPFYPPKLAAAKMLGFYAEHFSTVELNNTFYRMPKPDLLERWAAEVPDGFTFVLKASRRITHEKRLKDPKDNLTYLFDTVASLGDKLGPVYFQTPPNLKLDLERFDRFLEAVPEGPRVAFEFRHPTWQDEAVHERLRARNIALVGVDADPKGDDEPGAAPAAADGLVSTADWGYLRLRRCDYSDDELADWSRKIRAFGWRAAYVFFKHEDGAEGPLLAKRFPASP